jgi:formate dehydrogenase major subunit
MTRPYRLSNGLQSGAVTATRRARRVSRVPASNMAECHPVGFQWVMEAKARGARIFHVDPRFTRTSAMAHRHMPIRAGSDIVLLGALINHVLSGGHDFREYVLRYTNASVILDDEFQDTEDLDGLFSGYDAGSSSYDPETWAYADGQEAAPTAGARDEQEKDDEPEEGEPDKGDEPGGSSDRITQEHGPGATFEATPSETGPAEHRDDTLQHPRCVYQGLKRHFARYTPEMVEQVCGIAPDDFAELADAVVANSGPDRTTAPRLGRAAGAASAVTGPLVATYTGVLLADTPYPPGTRPTATCHCCSRAAHWRAAARSA